MSALQMTMRNFPLKMLSTLIVLILLQNQLCIAGIVRPKRDLSVWPSGADTFVYEQQPFLLWCNQSEPISTCKITFRSSGQMFNLNESATGGETFEYPSGAKLGRGECGIRVFKTASNMTGYVDCSVRTTGQDVATKRSIFLQVLTPPKIQLGSDNEHFEFTEGKQMSFHCNAEGGKPDKLELLIGDEVVASSNTAQLVRYSKVAHFSDHRLKVICRVHHLTSTQPWEEQKTLRVSFSPRAADVLDKEGKLRVKLDFQRGQNSSISIRINAFPKPNQNDWLIGGQDPDKIKFTAWDKLKTDGQFWVHGLDIINLSEEDFNIEILFTTSNLQGSVSIPVVLTKEKDYFTASLIIVGCIVISIILVAAVVFYWRKKLRDRMNLPSSKDHKYRLSKSAVATIKEWRSGSHIRDVDHEEMGFVVDLMKNSIPGLVSREFCKLEQIELSKIERSNKMLLLLLKEEDLYKEQYCSKLKIITLGHNEDTKQLVTFPPTKLCSLDKRSQLVISKHIVSFRGKKLAASDLFEDCIHELRITDLLHFKLEESGADPEHATYIPQALEATDGGRVFPSTSALVNEIITSRALRHLIVGDAGTGKSQTLFSLEKQFGESLCNYWILRKDLAHCNQLQCPAENINALDALRLLFEDVLLQLDAPQRRVLETKVLGGKVVVLVDSFDALWRKNVDSVLKLLDAVSQKGILVLATRSYRAKEVASKLKVAKTYQVAGLDQSELVSQHWKRMQVSKTHLEVNALLKVLSPTMSKVPLHLLLSAEYFASRAPTDVSLVEVLRDHVERALEQQQQALVRGVLTKLATFHLLEGEHCDKPNDTELQLLGECPLVRIRGGEAEFRHRSIGHFLFATAAMRRTFKQPMPLELKFKQILLSPEHRLLRGFMDQCKEEGYGWFKCFLPPERSALLAQCLDEKLFNLMRIVCQAEPVLPGVVQKLVDSNASSLGNFSLFLDYLENQQIVSDEDKSSALFSAFGAQNVELVRVLLHRGVHPEICQANSDVSSDSYLHRACTDGNLALVQLLAEVLDVEGVDGALGRTPLMLAVDNDRTEVAEYLLQAKDADANVVDANQDTCLHLAARSSDDRLLPLVMSRTSLLRVGAQNARGETALLCAAKCGRAANVRLLLSKGADPHLPDEDGRTPLHWATDNKHKEIADLLQSHQM